MEMMGEVRPPARLNTTIVLPSNPTLRWKRKFFNYLKLSESRRKIPHVHLVPLNVGLSTAYGGAGCEAKLSHAAETLPSHAWST